MPKIIPHRKAQKPPKVKRYVIQRKYSDYPGWRDFKEHSVLWVARLNARSWESYGYFEYRLVDRLGNE